MNKLAIALCLAVASCGAVTDDEPVEKTAGAVRYGQSSYVQYHVATNFHCTAPFPVGANFQFGIAMQVHPLNPPWGGQYASATYGVEIYKNIGETLSMYMATLPMVETMDGPYHLLTNPWPTGAGMWLNPNTTGIPVSNNWLKFPTEIPQYGLVIYAANERADYPNGVAVLSLDPAYNPINTTSSAYQGRCGSRRTFVFSL